MNVTFNENPLRPTPWEKSKGLSYYQLREITRPIEGYAFDIRINDISEADPDLLVKVVIKINI